MKPEAHIEHVMDTAYWMATYRVMETQRKDAIFKDLQAQVLVGQYGKKIAASMSSVERFAYWSLVTRTHLIDSLLLKYIEEGCTTVVNIGAGLDTRPYRLELPKSVKWIELDFPEIIEMKNEKLKHALTNCHLERIAVDLSDKSKRSEILSELNINHQSMIVLTEGVIPYLSEDLVSELAQDLREQENIKYWITEYYSPTIYKHFQAKSFTSLMGKSQFKFFPTDWISFFKKQGWVRRKIIYLYDVGEKVGRKFPIPWWGAILSLVFGKDKIAVKCRVQGYTVLEKY